MFDPSRLLVVAAGFSPAIEGSTHRKITAAGEEPRAMELWRIAAPRGEQAFFGICLLVHWLISAASLSGYIIVVLFLIVAVGRLVRHAAILFASRLPRRSQLRHYIVLFTSVAFFFLLALRGCYLAAVIVDLGFHSDPFEARSDIGRH
ncbi:hypothetical protein [Neorhizobium galegae]|uniref:hypothetical protein n=1 Tax=Neorhizobium galegae TaxID=399 RepID=UPI002035B3D7|nr:hypothetical protein [Neorhizobium galegae]MCM2499450.1 hypothetical protein [Neorhizobium galegae]MCQ1774017.1 hypothetical protein [Neorhizobium galegae]